MIPPANRTALIPLTLADMQRILEQVEFGTRRWSAKPARFLFTAQTHGSTGLICRRTRLQPGLKNPEPPKPSYLERGQSVGGSAV
jgi:hypothetical protein